MMDNLERLAALAELELAKTEHAALSDALADMLTFAAAVRDTAGLPVCGETDAPPPREDVIAPFSREALPTVDPADGFCHLATGREG